MARHIAQMFLLFPVFLCTSCSSRTAARPDQAADLIYTNGNVITINDAHPSAQAVAVKDGKVLAVGSNESVLNARGANTNLIDLQARDPPPPRR